MRPRLLCVRRSKVGIGWMQSEGRSGSYMILAVLHQCRVALRAHQLDQLRLMGEEDGLGGDVGLGVARAVPVEVVTARPPAAAVVLADRHLGVRRAVLALDGAVLPADRQLPADV